MFLNLLANIGVSFRCECLPLACDFCGFFYFNDIETYSVLFIFFLVMQHFEICTRYLGAVLIVFKDLFFVEYMC